MSLTCPGNNPTGINGYSMKRYPSDDKLREALLQYSKERLTVAERLTRLLSEFGLCIKKSRLHELNRQFNIPSPRKLPPVDVAMQAVLEKIAEDTDQANGVNAITSILSNEGIPLPRDFVRSVMASAAPDGLSARFPGGKKVRRSALVAIGPNQQHHADGFAKLNAQALQMGGVGLDIYGIKDQWSGFLLHLVVVPNHRLATTIGHVHLDYIMKYQAIPLTFVTDKGSETGIMFGDQTALRTVFAPNIDVDQYPPFLFLKSVHNTPIEGLWHWFLKTHGVNIKLLLQSGQNDGIYHPNKELHRQLFYWLWPKILQEELDNFVEYWNNHRIRYQKGKPNPSGTSPRHAFTVSHSYGGQDCKIAVTQDVIDALRTQIPISRKESMRWVSDDFGQVADRVYEELGCPDLTLKNGWMIFQQIQEMMTEEIQVDNLV